MRNLSTRPGLISIFLCVLAFSIGACSRRGLPSDAGFDCDATCEAQVKVQAISAGRLQVTEAQWKAAFASGKASIEHDPEWLGVIAEMKEQVCKSGTDSQKFRDWNERMSKKTNDDIFNDRMIGNATQPGDSPEVNEARAKVVKIQIVRYWFMRDLKACPK